jgi:CRP-like cAMP-binding protein
LPQVDFFKELSPRVIDVLLKDAFEINYQPGQFIFHRDEKADYFYIVLRGCVAVGIYPEKQGPKKIQTIGEGELLGWSWIIPPHRWRFDAMAQVSTRLLTLQGKQIRAATEMDHELGHEILKKVTHALSGRLEGARLQLLDLYGH